MVQFLAYDELTWPEVAALPRDIPFVLPLGSGYPIEQLASALSNPEKICLLPPVPFGWQGSLVSVPQPVLSAMLSNLLDSLRDDGFTRAYALIPPGVDLCLGASQIALPTDIPRGLGEVFGDHDNSEGKKNKVVFIPIGHTEQHGYHLPLSTDTLIIDAIARGVVDAAPERVARGR